MLGYLPMVFPSCQCEATIFRCSQKCGSAIAYRPLKTELLAFHGKRLKKRRARDNKQKKHHEFQKENFKVATIRFMVC